MTLSFDRPAVQVAATTSPLSLALARAHLRTAEGILARLGHTALLNSCRSLLAALSDPLSVTDSRVSRLTPREHDVGSMVVLGLTNREIAGSLHLSEKTVEYHLRNLYAKLGVNNRRELRHLSASPGAVDGMPRGRGTPGTV